MGGVNPYIVKPETHKPSKPFRITFHIEETGENKVFEVRPSAIPFGHTGLEGSIMDLAEGAGIEIDHSCGGVCACATCHVKVREGMKSCSRATEDEEDMLDTARDVEPDSRLSCQCVPDGSMNLVVEIPKWNKNLVQEGH
ncbi:MAG: 2Fe-2S iron-sulfur cluster binding domain-containing protein [Gemmataceae bacterium]|nr:2Fe-2S iron-sulfur cluster binding domain-containing protein [Gemmataceae bacterium]